MNTTEQQMLEDVIVSLGLALYDTLRGAIAWNRVVESHDTIEQTVTIRWQKFSEKLFIFMETQ